MGLRWGRGRGSRLKGIGGKEQGPEPGSLEWKKSPSKLLASEWPLTSAPAEMLRRRRFCILFLFNLKRYVKNTDSEVKVNPSPTA